MSRYIRQEALKEIGKKGQEMIKGSRVAIIGVGALGTTSAELIVRAGVGKVLLIDKDKVDLVNLQRQLLFDEKDIKKKKVVVAKEKLLRINSDVKIDIIDEFLDEKISESLQEYDLILDCTDNMKARHLINDYCEKTDKIWIYSAAVGVEGNVLVVDDYKKFRRLFKSGESFGSCEEIGVINSVTTVISSLQVTEAIKVLLGKAYCKDLIRFNVWENKYEKIKN